mmetsp:Transcript_1818/g.6456  ORF Transcript_1818/g.6456 Transcript_1818/m.6456 type:complete len:167 (-) Transcript_1818:1200-1700(-)
MQTKLKLPLIAEKSFPPLSTSFTCKSRKIHSPRPHYHEARNPLKFPSPLPHPLQAPGLRRHTSPQWWQQHEGSLRLVRALEMLLTINRHHHDDHLCTEQCEASWVEHILAVLKLNISAHTHTDAHVAFLCALLFCRACCSVLLSSVFNICNSSSFCVRIASTCGSG